MTSHSNPFTEADLNRVINLLWRIDDPWVRLESREDIDPREALIQPFSQARLAECLRLSEAGLAPPPVSVNRLFLGERRFYTVNDGQHRIEAARILGQPTVAAIVESELDVQLSRYELTAQHLLRDTGQRGRLIVAHAVEYTPEQWDALRWLLKLGVRVNVLGVGRRAYAHIEKPGAPFRALCDTPLDPLRVTREKNIALPDAHIVRCSRCRRRIPTLMPTWVPLSETRGFARGTRFEIEFVPGETWVIARPGHALRYDRATNTLLGSVKLAIKPAYECRVRVLTF